jgi:L-asparaginase II
MPLNTLALVYASFAAAADGKSSGMISTAERQHIASRIFKCMSGYPDMVGGSGRFCTDLMRVSGGMIIGKVGADGVYAIGVRASSHTAALGAPGAIGIAVKIEDGNIENVLYSTVLEVLTQLNLITREAFLELERFYDKEIKNTAGVVTGVVNYDFDIRD